MGTLIELYLLGRLRAVKCAPPKRGSHAPGRGADLVRALSPCAGQTLRLEISSPPGVQ